MFQFLKRKLNKGTGLLPDPRTIEEKAFDWRADEILTYAPPIWREKRPEEWRKFPIFNQNGSGSCVANTIAKLLGIENFLEEGKFVRYSVRDIYSQRLNFPNIGMWTVDAMNIGYKKGATLEQLMPSENKNEQEMNIDSDRKEIDKQIALVGKGGNYLYVPFSFNGIASVLEQTKKALTLGSNFNSNDWNNKIVITRKNGNVGHLVAIVDYTLYQGKKALVFDNSWGNWGFNGQGLLVEGNEAGVHSVCYYYDCLENNWRDKVKRTKPKYHFGKELMLGMNNFDVGMLKECLQYEELFPINYPTTWVYGSITAKAVLDFIKKYLPEKIKQYNGKKVDRTIREKLNGLFK